MKQIEVAAGVIQNDQGEILIAKRADDQHQGGLWEFPGGKVEPGETTKQALERELKEELGICVRAAEPLIRIHHQYPDKSVVLDVWRVTRFSGDARGVEGQPLEWVKPAQLDTYSFPAANMPILSAAQLPNRIAVLDNLTDIESLERRAHQAVSENYPWLMLRGPHNSETELRRAIAHVEPLSAARGVKLMLNCSIPLANKLEADALFLTAAHLLGMGARKEFSGRWLGAACHNPGELQLAMDKGLEFAALSPVSASGRSERVAIGWQRFAELSEAATIPVYARGGLSIDDLHKAQQVGAQGIMLSIHDA